MLRKTRGNDQQTIPVINVFSLVRLCVLNVARRRFNLKYMISKNLYRYIVCLIFGSMVNKSFSQQAIQLKIGKEEKAFTEVVRIISGEKENVLSLKDGSYAIDNGMQNANLIITNKLINGSASIRLEDHTKTDYVIVNSFVTSMKSYEGDVLNVDAHRDKTTVYFKTYYPNGKLKTDGFMSLDKHKYYGRGITKSYYENGMQEKIANSITETYTYFYPNGNKKGVSGLNILENYTEAGQLSNRQYRKNNIRYVDEYIDGKLYTRSYEGKDKSETKEYYKNGTLGKKEVLKIVSGKKRLLIYSNTGKLISNEPYEAASQPIY